MILCLKAYLQSLPGVDEVVVRVERSHTEIKLLWRADWDGDVRSLDLPTLTRRMTGDPGREIRVTEG